MSATRRLATDSGRRIKVVCRYQQYRAARKIVERAVSLRPLSFFSSSTSCSTLAKPEVFASRGRTRVERKQRWNRERSIRQDCLNPLELEFSVV